MRPACVLFDLDGTLIDHFKAIHRCHTHAMTRLGLPAPTMAQVRAAVGGGLDEAIARLAGRNRVPAIMPIYKEHWDATHLDDVVLLPGAREILTGLGRAGAVSAVLTNKRGYAAREVCDHLGLTPLLRGVHGVGDTPWLKPEPRWTHQVLAQLGAPAANSLYVGDSPFDIQTARQAGLAFMGVTTGTHTAEELRAAGAERVFADLIEVARTLGL
ncbi:MAG TPA: HAD family hydrolase [Lacunisphaera sp.]